MSSAADMSSKMRTENDHWMEQHGEHQWPWQEPFLHNAGIDRKKEEESETGSVDNAFQNYY